MDWLAVAPHSRLRGHHMKCMKHRSIDRTGLMVANVIDDAADGLDAVGILRLSRP